MDPLNGVADIENRELRLVSNYGFIEDPIRMVRAARLMARLGWTLDEKTQSRYETGKDESYIAALSEFQRGYELEEIFHEEDPLRVLKLLETEGWLTALAPAWNTAKVDVPALDQLREVQTQLQIQGLHPDASVANFPLLTAKLSAKETAALKASFVRGGFAKEIDSLEAKAKELAAQLTGKSASLPSETCKLLTGAPAEVVLWLAYSSKTPAVQTKFKNFFTVWPQFRQRIPYAIMQEMRIVPELAGYQELVEKLFFELMDDKLQTPEEIKAFLEPFSPPAPPPPVNTRRPRASKKDAKGKGRVKKSIALELDPDADPDDLDVDDDDDADELDEVIDVDIPDDDSLIQSEDLGDDLPAPQEDSAKSDEEDQDDEPVEPASKAKPATAKKVPKVTVVVPPKAPFKVAKEVVAASKVSATQPNKTAARKIASKGTEAPKKRR
jgi:hypothetical protein